MGLDFVALLKCPPINEMDDPRIVSLEGGSPRAMQDAVAHFKTLRTDPIFYNREGWVVPVEFEDPVERPSALTRQFAYRTRESFELLFDRKTVYVRNWMRWLRFLKDKKSQSTMLEAIIDLGKLLQATDGIVTNDMSPVIVAFEQGRCFDEALKAGTAKDGEVSTLDDLYEVDGEGTWDCHGYWRFL